MHLTQRHKGFAEIGIVALAVALQWYAHAGGLLKTPDSCNYLSASISFKNSFTFLSVDGTPYNYWPPLFPIVLSVLGDYWFWIQLLLAAWCSVLIISEVNRFIENKLVAFICQCSIVLGVHLLLIGTFLWSELLFLVLLLYFIKALEKNFVAAIVLGFLLCLQRHAGLFFVIGGAIWLWDVKRSTILLVASTSGLMIWNLFHAAVSDYNYFQHIVHNLNVMSTALMNSLAPLPGITLIVVVVALVYFLKHDVETRLMSIMLTSYLVFMSIIFWIEPSDTDRFIAVVVPFFMILFFRAFEFMLSKQTSAVRKVLMILIVCWLLYPFSRTVKNAVQWHNLSFTSYFCPIQF